MADVTGAGTFAAALDEAIRGRRMTLQQVRERLLAVGHPISLASLSYWRAGLREPERRRSLEAVPELERVLGLGEGALSGRLVRGGAQLPRPFDELVGEPTVESLVGESDVDRVVFQMTVDVGPAREVQRARLLQIFVARRAGVEGVTIFAGPDKGTQDNDVVLRAVSGCSVQNATRLGNGIIGTTITFERPLSEGEAVVTECEAVVDGRPDLETEYGLVAEQRLEEAMIWVRFHPDCLPARAWVWFDEDGLQHAWPAALDGATGLHYRQTDFGPGSLGARWEW
ncbi:hypothetical protein [Aeromicrobium alkaliterrae]|uniref:XRE family transcriptional regulator n=1 Tax=Aeromicrobium alkaliterrae TaxID=302168 RepID=A0ABN2K0Z9_9ACTN